MYFFPPCRVFSEITDEWLFWVRSGLPREQLVMKPPMMRKGKMFQGQGEFGCPDLSGGERVPGAGGAGGGVWFCSGTRAAAFEG